MRRLFGVFLAILLVTTGCGGGGGGGGGGAGGGGEIPPGNIVWFGTGFDPATLALVGRATSLPASGSIVAVGRIFTARPPAEVQVSISKGSTVKPPIPVGASNSPDSADVFAVDLKAQGVNPGTWIVSFVTSSGQILASGFVTIT